MLTVYIVLVACEGETTVDTVENNIVQGEPWFEEIANEVGLKFTHESGHNKSYLFPEIIAGGCALFDMDNDGDLDAYLVQSGSLIRTPDSEQPTNRLFRNDGKGRFVDVTSNSGADDSGYGVGVTAGDYDNDGYVDLYITNVGANVLLHNEGNGTFTDVSELAGVDDDNWGCSAAFLDADLDGDLDIFVTNYVRWSIDSDITCRFHSGQIDYCSPNAYDAPVPDVLYRNNGDGSFTDVSIAAGLRSAFGNGLGVVCGDFNSDGLVDIFVANDQRPNQLWENRGNLHFEDVALLRGCAFDQNGEAKAGMGVTAVDIDDDVDLDIFVVNLRAETDSLYRNNGNYFSDDTIEFDLGVVTKRYTRFGVGILDFNHDGWLDIFVANGAVLRLPQSTGNADDPYAEVNCLLRGSSEGKFQEVFPTGGTSKLLLATSRAAAFGDVDNDGDIDILIVNKDAQAYLLSNIAPKQGQWILFRVIDEQSRDAIGAVISIWIGDRIITREVRRNYSYCASNDPRVHFGLGSATKIDRIEVRWPDQVLEQYPPIDKLDQLIELRRGQGIVPSSSSKNH